MKFKQSVNLLLIALFVWAFQGTTIHFQHHVLEEISECKVCDASKNMNLYQHNTPMVVFNENLAVKTRNRIKKIVVKLRFDYTAVPKAERVYSVEDQQYSVEAIPIGFNATAPPYFTS